MASAPSAFIAADAIVGQRLHRSIMLVPAAPSVSAAPSVPIVPSVVAATSPVRARVPASAVITTPEAPRVAIRIIRVTRVGVISPKPDRTGRCAVPAWVINHLSIRRSFQGKEEKASATQNQELFHLCWTLRAKRAFNKTQTHFTTGFYSFTSIRECNGFPSIAT